MKIAGINRFYQHCISVFPHSTLSILYKISGVANCKALAVVQSH